MQKFEINMDSNKPLVDSNAEVSVRNSTEGVKLSLK